MAGDFVVSVKLGAEVTGTSAVKQLTTTLDDCLKKLSDGNAAVAGAAQKAREEIAKTNTAATVLARDSSKAFSGDMTKGLKQGLTDAESKVKVLSADLKAMYAAKRLGDPSKVLRAAIEQTERKLQSASAELKKFQELSGKGVAAPTTPAISGGGLDFGTLVGGLTTANILTQAITEGFRAMKDAVASVITEGMRINEFLESSRLGIATSVVAQYNLVDAQGKLLEGQEAYNAALAISEEQMYAIRVAGLETAATSEELVRSFQVAMASGASQGITDLTKLRELTVNVTNAATAMGVAQAEVPVALRAVISGRELEATTIGKTLGLTGELVRSWQEQGTLVENLEKRLASYTVGAKAAASSWKVVKSNIEEAFQVFSGQVTSGLFEQLSKSANAALSGVFDTKNLGISESFSAIAGTLKDIFDGVGTIIGETIAYLIESAKTLNKFLQDNAETIGEFEQGFKEIYVAVKEVFKAVFDIIGAMAGVRSETGQIKLAVNAVLIGLKGVSLLLAGIADGARAVGGVLIWVGGLIATALIYPLEKALENIGNALNTVKAGWGDAMLSASKSMGQVGAKVRSVGADLLAPLANGTSAVQKLMKAFGETGASADSTEKKVKKLGGTIGDVKFPTDKKKELLAAATAESEALFAIVKDRLAREQRELDYQLSQEKISIERYYAERKRLQLEALAGEITAKEQVLANVEPGTKNDDKRIKLQSDINILRAKEGDIILDNNRKAEEATRTLEAKVLELTAQLEQDTGTQTAETVAATVSAKFRDVRNQFVTEFGAASKQVNLVDSLINVETTKAKFAILQKQYQDTMTAMQLAESQIRSDEESGILSSSEAALKLNAIHQQTGAELATLIPQMQEYAGVLKDPAISLSVQKLGQDLTTMTAVATEAGRQMADSLESSFATLFEDIATGSKSAGDAVADFARSVVASIAKIASQQMASSIMSGIFGGAQGGATGFFSKLFMAGGGSVPGSGDGDTVPAMLTPGEFVLRKSVVRRLGTGFLTLLNGVSSRNVTGRYAEGGPVQSILSPAQKTGVSRLQVGLDDGLILRQMDTPQYEKKLIEIISRNPNSLRSVLA
jgi:hypothetical protein